mmetsp:Transcript_881/g.2129  ORF Transcript_881/g.2129 Transcript_881/m.2129 type:complete len:225 (-) Transcript_881:189-863(-)
MFEVKSTEAYEHSAKKGYSPQTIGGQLLWRKIVSHSKLLCSNRQQHVKRREEFGTNITLGMIQPGIDDVLCAFKTYPTCSAQECTHVCRCHCKAAIPAPPSPVMTLDDEYQRRHQLPACTKALEEPNEHQHPHGPPPPSLERGQTSHPERGQRHHEYAQLQRPLPAEPIPHVSHHDPPYRAYEEGSAEHEEALDDGGGVVGCRGEEGSADDVAEVSVDCEVVPF